MKQYLYFLPLFFLMAIGVKAQQNDDLKFNIENQFINNPAAISSFNELRISSYYLKQFTAIENAPTDIFVSFQSPIPYQRAMVGFAILKESAGLVQNLKVNLSGAYKIPKLVNQFDYLSIGLGFNYSNIGVNGSQVDLVDNSDRLSNIGDVRASGFNIGIGGFYSSTSTIDYKNGKTAYQIGLSATKTIPQSLNFSSFAYQDALVFSGFGSVYLPIQNSVINPYAELQLEDTSLANINLGLRAILESALILGVSIDNDAALGFQAGYRTPNVINGGSIQILAQSVVPLGAIDNYINTGFGLSLQYIFDMTNFL